MVDLEAVRRTIAVTPPNGNAAVVTRRWLEEVEQDLSELAQIRTRKAARS